MHALVTHRLVPNDDLVHHSTIICSPIPETDPQAFLVGLMGVINGIVREDASAPPIDAVLNPDGELICFQVRGDNRPAPDMRAVAIQDLREGRRYCVRDRNGTRWEGLYAGPGQHPNQGVHLRLSDGALARIYFHDVAGIIRA